jgi:hypothetical protein
MIPVNAAVVASTVAATGLRAHYTLATTHAEETP